MSGLDYVRDAEVAAIPVLQREVKHVVYGPLSDFPTDPEVGPNRGIVMLSRVRCYPD